MRLPFSSAGHLYSASLLYRWCVKPFKVKVSKKMKRRHEKLYLDVKKLTGQPPCRSRVVAGCETPGGVFFVGTPGGVSSGSVCSYQAPSPAPFFVVVKGG